MNIKKKNIIVERKVKYPERKKFLQSKSWKLFRKIIIERDHSTCCLCHTKTKRPKVHHIVQDKTLYKNLDENNFVVLCSACHDFISAMIPRKNIDNKIAGLIKPYFK
jgi:5-methylcytosine-specific restriction endonuclease McrA